MTKTMELENVEQKVVMKKRKGFTLVELGAVLAILAVLLMLIVPRFSKATDNAKITVVEANHRALMSAVQLYVAQDAGAAYPADIPALVTAGLSAPKTDLDGKPANSTYTITGNQLISVLKIGTVTYTWTYDFATGTNGMVKS